MGLLFIPQLIYKHGETWWNGGDRRKLLICPPELWQSYQQSSGSKQEEWSKEVINLALQGISIHSC
jgi:hypothetical protein